MKRLIQNALGVFGLSVMRKSSLERLAQNFGCVHDLEFLKAIAPEARSACIDLLDKSKSQLRQDLFALTEVDFKKNGYFVEFGAANGVDLSNSYLLETEFHWSGILAEPARMWHDALKRSRSAAIDTRCVWKETGAKLRFNETDVRELSTIDIFSGSDRHSKRRASGNRYNVETVSLIDLLEAHSAPSVIDYLSIDTEGSEFEILRNFDFDRYRFNVITCEHNQTSMREKIFDLLTRNGYQRKFERLSRIDDWYVGIAR